MRVRVTQRSSLTQGRLQPVVLGFYCPSETEGAFRDVLGLGFFLQFSFVTVGFGYPGSLATVQTVSAN